MNEFEKELLTIAYNNYLKSPFETAKFVLKNGNDFMNYHTAAQYLVDENLIIPISDNIMSDSISVFDIVLEFDITDKGISAMKNILKR